MFIIPKKNPRKPFTGSGEKMDQNRFLKLLYYKRYGRLCQVLIRMSTGEVKHSFRGIYLSYVNYHNNIVTINKKVNTKDLFLGIILPFSLLI